MDTSHEDQIAFMVLTAIWKFRSPTAVQTKRSVSVPWQHSTVSYCWHLHAGEQQYNGKGLLRLHGNNGYGNAQQ